MSLIVHLSDLHLLADANDEQDAICDGLVETLRQEVQLRAASVDLVAITGDVFDTVGGDPKIATARFDKLFCWIQAALGGGVMSA